MPFWQALVAKHRHKCPSAQCQRSGSPGAITAAGHRNKPVEICSALTMCTTLTKHHISYAGTCLRCEFLGLTRSAPTYAIQLAMPPYR